MTSLAPRTRLRIWICTVVVVLSNAFGDFFPGLVDAAGRSVHRVEIEATARAHGLREAD